MKAFRLVAVLMLVGAMATGVANASLTWVKWGTIGFYDLPSAPDGRVEIKEAVYEWREPQTGEVTLADPWGNTDASDHSEGVYLYRYWVTCDGDVPVVTTWGFTEGFQSGGGFVAAYTPSQLTSGAVAGWTVSGNGTAASPVLWTTTGTAINFIGGGTLEGFGIVANGVPHTYYNAKAGSGSDWAVSPDKVSGPTPEPVSGVLLVVSLGLYGLLGRRRE